MVECDLCPFSIPFMFRQPHTDNDLTKPDHHVYFLAYVYALLNFTCANLLTVRFNQASTVNAKLKKEDLVSDVSSGTNEYYRECCRPVTKIIHIYTMREEDQLEAAPNL